MAFNRAGVDGFGKRGVDQHRCDGRVSFFFWFPQPVDRSIGQRSRAPATKGDTAVQHKVKIGVGNQPPRLNSENLL